MTDMSYPEAIQEYGNHIRLITETLTSMNVPNITSEETKLWQKSMM